MTIELTKAEESKLRGLMDISPDIPLTLDTLFKYGVAKLEPSKRLPIEQGRLSEWLKVEFLYHGDGWHLDCYIRFSDKKDYYGAGCGLHWRPYENIHIALARALLNALAAEKEGE